jgi:uncharacterized phage protein (TIGR02220 family)
MTQVGEGKLFAKVDANLDTNAKIVQAGRFGREVFEFLLRRNRINGAKGWVPAVEADPGYLSRMLWMPLEEANQGVTACVTAALIRVEPPRVVILGWDEDWGAFAKSNAERQQSYRDRQSRNGERNAVVTSNASNGSEKIRSEKKRSDQKERESAPRGFRSWESRFSQAELEATDLLLSKMNRWTGVKYTRCKAHVALVAARMRDGISVDDMRAVVGYVAVSLKWADEEKTRAWICPETLLGPEKIHKHLASARAWYEREIASREASSG